MFCPASTSMAGGSDRLKEGEDSNTRVSSSPTVVTVSFFTDLV